MKTWHRPRFVLAGTGSGVGKTTLATGLLAMFRSRGLKVQPFKIGPDYIDPGFHSKAAGRESYNLDTWLVPEERLVPDFAALSEDADLSVIEGVMGLFDGGRGGVSSTADIAKKLQAPVILVLNCQSVGVSAAAEALGFFTYDRDVNMAGVILNRLGSDTHEAMIREAMEALRIPVLGALHREESLKTPERHLGLTPVTETDASEVIRHMKEAAEQSVDGEVLLRIARSAPDFQASAEPAPGVTWPVRIGVAMDEAFSFYYPASLKALERLGAELVPFSPLQDSAVPDADGLIFGGGFPEMFLDRLSENRAMQSSIRSAASAGMPVYAECGGLMYLCRSIRDFEGHDYSMTGVVPAGCAMEKRLQRVGYVTAEILKPHILGNTGDRLKGHEFHFSMLDGEPADFPYAYRLQGTRQKTPHNEGYAQGRVLATYLHLSFEGNPAAAQHFLSVCMKYKEEKNHGAKRTCSD